MKLWAISDLHVGFAENRRVVEAIPAHPEDWLILGGDLGECVEDLQFVVETLRPRFARVLWVPGNHELWSVSPDALRGEARYAELVAFCRRHDVLTPEDEYVVFDDGRSRHLLAPLFVLYDYSFAPRGMLPHQALAWALEEGLECADERLLHPDPYATRQEWCAARCRYSEARLAEATTRHAGPTVLINHFPLREELAVLPLVPRFTIWCGTQRTHDWHLRFRAEVVVYGHLHIPGTRTIDGVRFEEVSLGYPRQRRRFAYETGGLRQILPA